MRAWVAALVVAFLLAGCAEGTVGPPTTTSTSATPSKAPTRTSSGTSTTQAPTSEPTTEPTTEDPLPEENVTEEEPAAPSPPRTWPEPDAATIRPGVQLDDGNCTSNFIFTSLDNATVYIGTAAHCFGNGSPTDTDGCDQPTPPDPIGTLAKVDGANAKARLVYSSWLTMMERDEGDASACSLNDFALLELDPGDHASVSPAMLVFGGPTKVADPADVGGLDKVLTYGNSGTRSDIDQLSPHEGYVVSAPGPGGWSTTIYTVGPGIPGDSGSGVLLGDGQALGIMVTLQSFPPAGNGVTTLRNAMDYACESGFCVQLATWEQLSPGLVPV